MPLGIEQNNLAPALIQGNGQALVQGIRQIGQQISGHLTELQTKRDLAALGQEAQSLSVDSNDFPVQLAQLVTRHPLAARDERGKMLLAPLGQAHGFWRAEESDARAFERAMRMQAQRTTDARSQSDYEEGLRNKRPINVPGVGLVQPNEIDDVTGNAKVLVPAAPRMGSNRPLVVNPGDIVVDPSGKQIAANPKPVVAPAANLTDARMRKKNNMDLLVRQDVQTQREIDDAIKRLDAIQKQDLELAKDDAKPGSAKKDFLVTTALAIQGEVKALRERRAQLQKKIEEIEAVPAEAAVEAELGPAPDVLPPSGAITTKIKVDKATGKRYEVDIATNKTLREVP